MYYRGVYPNYLVLVSLVVDIVAIGFVIKTAKTGDWKRLLLTGLILSPIAILITANVLNNSGYSKDIVHFISGTVGLLISPVFVAYLFTRFINLEVVDKRPLLFSIIVGFLALASLDSLLILGLVLLAIFARKYFLKSSGTQHKLMAEENNIVKTGFLKGYFIWLKSSPMKGAPPHIPYWLIVVFVSFVSLVYFGGGLLDFIFGFLGVSIIWFWIDRLINKSKK